MAISTEPMLWPIGKAEVRPSLSPAYVEDVFERYAPHFTAQPVTVESLSQLGVKVTRATETMLKFTIDYSKLEFTD